MANSGEIGLAAEKPAKIDNVQGQKRAWRVATIVALRGLPGSNDISPKHVPGPSRTAASCS